MSASSDLHIETINLAADWCALVGRILNQAAVGRSVSQKPDEQPSDEQEWREFQFAPDLAFTPTGESDPVAVEIKMLRWRRNWLGWVSNAVAHMEQIIARSEMKRGIIILTLPVEPAVLAELNAGTGGQLQIWDLEKLRELAASTPDLADALDDLAADTILDGLANQTTPRLSDTSPGTTIARRLRITEPGRDDWQEYESECYEAIRFLFAGELQNLIKQQKSDDGLNRMDLIGRIRAEPNTFWSMVAGDFSSRYVVFDAKNSATAIGQEAIHSTAKYLMPKGLRKVAILLAREGATDNALQACAGYLRHDGFLILVVSLNDLCGMLEGKDAGDPPENLLFARMDEALMALNR